MKRICSIQQMVKVMGVLFFGLAIISICDAQEIKGRKETVSFSIPKTLYFPGEKIWIDATVLLDQSPSPSQVLYAELIDASSNSVDYAKIPLVQGKSLNYIQVKSSIPSANYLLRVYTRISPYLDLEVGVAQQVVTIVNPTIPPQLIQEVKRSEPALTSSFKRSEPIGAKLKDPGKDVVSMGFSLANPFLPEEQKPISSSDAYASLEARKLLPELFGHIVELHVPNSPKDATYFLSVHGKQSALYTDLPDTENKLLFDVGGLKNWDRMIIQLENGEEMTGIEVLPPLIKTRFKGSFQLPQLSLSESDLPLLQKLIKAAQVEAYYKEVFQLDSMEIVTGFVADYSYNLDDYTRFETVETVLREYVPSVFVRNRDKKKEFRLVDEAGKRVFETNPLILVDAMPVFDSDLLATFNPKFMQRLEVLNREFYLNERTFPGVLSWSSYENNFGLFPLAANARFFDYLGLNPLVEIDRSQFTQPAKEAKFPDWRTILYWETSGANMGQITSPDLDGVFMLWVKSLDSEGRIRVERAYYSVLP